VEECEVAGKNPEFKELSENNLRKLNFHIRKLTGATGIKPGSWISYFNYSDFNDISGDEAKVFLDSVKTTLRKESKILSLARDSVYLVKAGQIGEGKLLRLRETDYNDRLADFVLNRNATNRIYESENKLIQKADPVFMPPGSKYGRAHFYAPYKQLGSQKIGTMIFNVAMMWLMTITFFATLYFNLLKRFIVLLERLKLPIWRKFGRELLQK
jgi:hypothetical protein